MVKEITLELLTAEAFAPFGDVLECSGGADRMINQNKCERFHDRAQLDFTTGAAGISIFNSEIYTLPFELEMMERHPLGSQAFIPMSEHPFAVIVAPDQHGVPGEPRAFKTRPGQAVNYHKGTWHGVLTPLFEPGLFAVVDRIGDGANLEEHWFNTPYLVTGAL